MPGVGELFTGAGSGGKPVSIPHTINKQESKGNAKVNNPRNSETKSPKMTKNYERISVPLIPPLTLHELYLCFSYPLSTPYVVFMEMKASNKAREMRNTGLIGSGDDLPGESQNVVDAVRHSLYAYYLSMAGGEDLARQYLYAHEKYIGNKPDDMRMDMHNNELGLALARGVRNGEISENQVESIIASWAKSRTLRYLKKGEKLW